MIKRYSYAFKHGVLEQEKGEYVLYSDYEKLKAQLGIALEAVNYYADKENWDGISREWLTMIDSDDWETKSIGDDGIGGLRARQVLSKLKGDL